MYYIIYISSLLYLYHNNILLYEYILGYPTGYSQHNTPNTW